MLVGIGFVALLTAAAAERFIKTGQARGVEAELKEVNARLERLERALRDRR